MSFRVVLISAATIICAAAAPQEKASAANPCAAAEATARIGPEEGERIVIRGRVLRTGGVTPAAGVIAYAYQTGADGLYHEGKDGLPRLHAFMKTDAQGRFRLETVRPGPYPGGGTPAHIHFQFWGRETPAQWGSELLFSDDPRAEEAAARGDWFTIVTLSGTPPAAEAEFVLKPRADRFQEGIRHGLRACGKS